MGRSLIAVDGFQPLASGLYRVHRIDPWDPQDPYTVAREHGPALLLRPLSGRPLDPYEGSGKP